MFDGAEPAKIMPPTGRPSFTFGAHRQSAGGAAAVPPPESHARGGRLRGCGPGPLLQRRDLGRDLPDLPRNGLCWRRNPSCETAWRFYKAHAGCIVECAYVFNTAEFNAETKGTSWGAGASTHAHGRPQCHGTSEQVSET